MNCNIVYSVILPIRNEEESLPQLFDEIEQTFRGKSYEIIAVDDASGHADHFGKWEALRTGIARAKGSIIITMDSDLQDDPKELPILLTTLNQGFDIVSGWRKNRQDPFYKIVLTRFANILYGFHDFSSPYKVYRKEALAKLPKDGSLLRYSFLFARTFGLHIAEVPVAHRARLYGQSKFGIIKYVRIFYDLILIRLLFCGSNRI
ncbi:MAG: glycosyltransferase family 2 protein [Candidatus Gottesmanbacteria bacterium]|nr:glycosyltransferase family 2 protein [Candidatus Gottesmanbacteria bacterium]